MVFFLESEKLENVYRLKIRAQETFRRQKGRGRGRVIGKERERKREGRNRRKGKKEKGRQQGNTDKIYKKEKWITNDADAWKIRK